MADCV